MREVGDSWKKVPDFAALHPGYCDQLHTRSIVPATSMSEFVRSRDAWRPGFGLHPPP